MVMMTRRPERRATALTKARIVEAAIAILDADGESALTFRALGARLATGSGAIYWHVADKSDLLGAAVDGLVSRVLAHVGSGSEPREAIRAIAHGLFDAVDAHPWMGAQLFREPTRPATVLIFEAIGGRLEALGVPGGVQFATASALVNYILGVAGQNAANARLAREAHRSDRSAFLATVAAHWEQLDPKTHPFVRRMAAQLREHDDREQFMAGVDLILAGAELAP